MSSAPVVFTRRVAPLLWLKKFLSQNTPLSFSVFPRLSLCFSRGSASALSLVLFWSATLLLLERWSSPLRVNSYAWLFPLFFASLLHHHFELFKLKELVITDVHPTNCSAAVSISISRRRSQNAWTRCALSIYANSSFALRLQSLERRSFMLSLMW